MASRDALDTTAAAVEAVAALARVDWEQVHDPDLLAAADQIGRLKAMADASLVSLSERLAATGAADAAGWASSKDFLTHVLGGRKGAGGTYERIAKQTAELPAVREAMAAGEVSLAQASVIGTRTTTLPQVPELRTAAADKLLDLVHQEQRDATDLDRAFAGVVKELDPDGKLLGSDLSKEKQERGAHHARFLSFTNDSVGGVRVKGYGTIEDVELIKTALMPLAAPVTTEPGACGGNPDPFAVRDAEGRRISQGCPDPGCFHDGKDPRDGSKRMWDALVEACRRLQATDSLPHAHGASARIFVTTTLDDLMDKVSAHDAGGVLPSEDTLSAAAVRRLACDAEIIPGVLGSDGQILDVGRASRLVTAAIWLALVLRDQHCAFPACTRPPIACDAHHIVHWADGGPTSLDNLVLLCRKHHTVAHQTPWRVEIDPRTRRPVWIPPPLVDDRDRFSYYRPPQKPPPKAA